MRNVSLALLFLLISATSSCTFFASATEWNGRVGPNGKPVHVKTATKVGLNALVILPFIGDMDIQGLVSDITGEIQKEGGDKVTVFQAGSENYWYGFPPFTWIITPVISTVATQFEVGSSGK